MHDSLEIPFEVALNLVCAVSQLQASSDPFCIGKMLLNDIQVLKHQLEKNLIDKMEIRLSKPQLVMLEQVFLILNQKLIKCGFDMDFEWKVTSILELIHVNIKKLKIDSLILF